MNVYTCTDFDSFWLGGCAVIVAESPEHALKLLTEEREDKKALPIELSDIELLDTTTPAAHILFNGNY